MSTDTLFDLSAPGLRRSRRDTRKATNALKREHEMFTHYCQDGGWLAMHLPSCRAALEGYELTELERTDGVVMLAGYCRLLDEAGLVHEDHKTEREAVLAAIGKLSLPNIQTQTGGATPPPKGTQ